MWTQEVLEFCYRELHIRIASFKTVFFNLGLASSATTGVLNAMAKSFSVAVKK